MSIPLENHLCFALYSTAHAFTRAYRPLLKPFNLTYPQYLVIKVLSEYPKASLTLISEKLMLDSGTLSPLLQRLIKQGLVTKSRDVKDERAIVVSLTAKGFEIAEQVQSIPMQLACSIGETLEGHEPLLDKLKILQQALKKI